MAAVATWLRAVLPGPRWWNAAGVQARSGDVGPTAPPTAPPIHPVWVRWSPVILWWFHVCGMVAAGASVLGLPRAGAAGPPDATGVTSGDFGLIASKGRGRIVYLGLPNLNCGT